MPRYAEVLPCPGRQLDAAFTYALPVALRTAARPGLQVLVPFGAHTVPGLLVEIHDRPPPRPIKEVLQLCPEAPGLDPASLQVARWMADYYWCSLGAALRCFLPEGTAWTVKGEFRLTPAGAAAAPASLVGEHPEAARALRALLGADGSLRLDTLAALMGEAAPRAAAWLRRRELAVLQYRLDPPPVRTRREQVVAPALPPEDLLARAEALPPRLARRAVLLRYLAACPEPLPPSRLAAQAGVGPAVVSALVKEGLLVASTRPVRRRPWAEVAPLSAPVERLMGEQRAALAAILAACGSGSHRVFLLHGTTASGKSEVFFRAAAWVVAQGGQVIVLVPEISLSAQLLALLQGRFGDRVALLHSALSPGERFDEWQRIQRAEAQVVIGARSAVFAPCPHLGLVVVDEEHDDSYQQDHDPRYHARQVAIQRAHYQGVPVVLSSATPALESYYAAQQGRYHLLTMKERVDSRPLPRAIAVDLRRSPAHRSIFTPPLTMAAKQALDRGEQVILFLNRRGFANFLLCVACGHVPRCPDCDLSYTYHQHDRTLRCHHCGRLAAPPDACPGCGGVNIAFSGFGTERVEQELERILPGTTHTRMDRDTTARKGSHARIVDQFRRQAAQVLIGTQMVAKGFDFPGVTLVGVLCADASLRLPDYRAGERTFQLLTQVSGRAGRGAAPGLVVVQTYDPEHYAIRAALTADFDAFYHQELASRREHGFPPFASLVRLLTTGEDGAQVEKLMQELASSLERERPERGRLLGPSPAPLARLANRHRWHLLALAPDHDQLAAWLRRAGVTPGRRGGVSLVVNFDPVDTM